MVPAGTESNLRRSAYKTVALPLSYTGKMGPTRCRTRAFGRWRGGCTPAHRVGGIRCASEIGAGTEIQTPTRRLEASNAIVTPCPQKSGALPVQWHARIRRWHGTCEIFQKADLPQGVIQTRITQLNTSRIVKEHWLPVAFGGPTFPKWRFLGTIKNPVKRRCPTGFSCGSREGHLLSALRANFRRGATSYRVRSGMDKIDHRL